MGPIRSIGHDDCCHLSIIAVVIVAIVTIIIIINMNSIYMDIIIIIMASIYMDLSADLSLIDSSHKPRYERQLLSHFFT